MPRAWVIFYDKNFLLFLCLGGIDCPQCLNSLHLPEMWAATVKLWFVFIKEIL
jgi:hypothetical protein